MILGKWWGQLYLWVNSFWDTPAAVPSHWKLYVRLNMIRAKNCFMHICIPLISTKPFRRSCVDEIYPVYLISKNSMLDYLPLHLSASNLASCISTYHVLPLYQFSLKSLKLYRRSWAYEIYPVYFIKKSMWHYLPLQLLVGNHLASCTSAYHVLWAYQVSLKSIKPFRRSCAYWDVPSIFH